MRYSAFQVAYLIFVSSGLLTINRTILLHHCTALGFFHVNACNAGNLWHIIIHVARAAGWLLVPSWACVPWQMHAEFLVFSCSCLIYF